MVQIRSHPNRKSKVKVSSPRSVLADALLARHAIFPHKRKDCVTDYKGICEGGYIE